jgi:hypothetical protein
MCRGDPSPASFIDKQEFRLTLHCQNDCFSLTSMQIVAEVQARGPGFRGAADQPRDGGNVDRWEIAPRSAQFRQYGRGNEDVLIERRQKFQATDPREIQDRRRVGDNNQSLRI